MPSDGLDGLDVGIISGNVDPRDALREIVRRLHVAPEPDVDLISRLGVGPLESLFHHGHEEELWPEVEHLARTDERFRRALSSAWAYDSPMFERREALLEELGEARRVSLSFVVYPEDFAVPPLLAYRAVDVDGSVLGGQLPRILREIADSFERNDSDQPPELLWDRTLSNVMRPWMEARWALKRALHQLDVSSDSAARTELFEEIDRRRQVEADARTALRTVAVGGSEHDT